MAGVPQGGTTSNSRTTLASDRLDEWDAEALRRYVAERRAAYRIPSTRARNILKRIVSEDRQEAVRAVLTDAISPWLKMRAAQVARLEPLRLHLGSGRSRKEGWVDVDLVFASAGVDLAWNLKRPLPFEAGTVDAIFHEHLLEHLPVDAAMALLAESRRLLRVGGVLRVGVPDAGAYLRAYAHGGGVIEAHRPGRPTRMLAIQELFYVPGHRTMYDAETLALVMRAAGWCDPEVREFGDSRIQPCPDDEARRDETLYMEVVVR